MIDGNGAEVVSLQVLKEKRIKDRLQSEYSRYLKSLGISQLEEEAHHLLDEFSQQKFGADYSLKVNLLLIELAGRADEPFRNAIRSLGAQINTEL